MNAIYPPVLTEEQWCRESASIVDRLIDYAAPGTVPGAVYVYQKWGADLSDEQRRRLDFAEDGSVTYRGWTVVPVECRIAVAAAARLVQTSIVVRDDDRWIDVLNLRPEFDWTAYVESLLQGRERDYAPSSGRIPA